MSWLALAVGCFYTFGPAISALVAQNRNPPLRANGVDPDRGVILLWFRNKKYASLAAPSE